MKENYFALSVYNYGRKKLCDLYDGNVSVAGQAQDIKITYEIGGWKEMSFSLPVKAEGERNFRLNYMHPEYLLRVVDGEYVDWYVINEPSSTHNASGSQATVTARHLSTLLKSKNLYLVFDDENGIDTMQALMRKILRGTDWTLGICDTFYEADGVTEKVRSLKSDGKEGAYQLITEVCELFRAYPTFHGDSKTVDIHALQGKDGMMELNFGSNLSQITKKKNSDNVVTRLYVEGEYLDDGGYVGIEDVNPTGLGFILNFDHFKDLGVFTQEHQELVDQYVDQAGQLSAEIVENAGESQKKASQLNALWGQIGYVVYRINGVVQDKVWGGGACESDAGFATGDELVVVKQLNGAITTEKKECAMDAEPGWPAGTVYAVKYITPAAGSIGGKEVAVEAKEETIDNYEKQIADPDTSESMKAKYQESIAVLEEEIAALCEGSASASGLYQMTYDACALAMEIGALEEALESLSTQQLDLEADFVIGMGDMLRDGYWSNTNYIPGQEQALYEDALEVSKEMSRPEITYTIGLQDLSEASGHPCDAFKVNQQLRIYDPEMGLNDYAYISKLVRNIGQEYKNTIEVTTSELGVNRHSLQSSLARMNAIAEQVAQKKEIYARASALTEGGQLSAAALNGIIDVNRVQILSTMSNWRTDEQGNMLFEALDGESAMMLSGSGFAIATGRREDGSWDWRTFGTGKGFTADEINAGTLNAGQITILGTDDFFWDADSIRIYTDESGEKQIRIGRYNGVDYGIGFTNDGGMTWQTALTSEGLAITEGSITVDKLAPNVGAQLDLSSNTTITLDVSALENRIAQAELKLEPDQIVATVRGSQAYQDDQSALESSVTAVGQTANKIYWLIDSGSTQSSMQMTDKALEVIASDIDLTGKVTFSALSSDAVSQINQGAVNTVETGLANGTTTINGGCITTGTINGNQVNVTNLKAGSITSGTMSADRISGGTIDARDVSITNLNASNITSGMLSADRIDVSTLKPDRIVSATNNNSYFTITNNGLDFYWEGSYMGRIYVDSYGAMGIMGQSAAILKSSGGVVISGGNAGLIEISDDPKQVQQGGSGGLQSGCSIVLKTGSVQTAGGSTSSNVPVAEIEGHLIPAENASNNSTGYLIGSNDARWRRLLSYSGVDTSSDVRLKSDITDQDALWLLKKLKPKRYHKNGEHGWYMGFVAQDVEEAIRDTQMQDCDLYHDGGEDGYASLCYEELIAPLVQGWQEHEKKMAQMQEEIDALKKKLDEQEGA